MPSKCLGKTILSHSLPNFPENHKVLFFWFFPSERRPHPRLVVTGGKASAELSAGSRETFGVRRMRPRPETKT